VRPPGSGESYKEKEAPHAAARAAHQEGWRRVPLTAAARTSAAHRRWRPPTWRTGTGGCRRGAPPRAGPEAGRRRRGAAPARADPGEGMNRGDWRRGGGTGRRGRRLTLAPSIRQALLPSPEPTEEEEDEERRAARGREELPAFVEAVVAVGRGPKLVHAVQDQDQVQLGAIHSKFWSCSHDQSDSEEEDDDLSTPEFIQRAQEVRCSVDELLRADKTLASGNDPNSEDVHLTCSILAKMVNRKFSGGVP